MNATQKYIDEFQREQALWRQKKREEMEEENRKIIEFANIQQQREGERIARVQETEEKRAQRQNLVWKWLLFKEPWAPESVTQFRSSNRVCLTADPETGGDAAAARGPGAGAARAVPGGASRDPEAETEGESEPEDWGEDFGLKL